MRQLIIVLLFSMTIFSCNKKEESSGKKVEIFLLESYDTLSIAIGYQIELESVVTKNEIFIPYKDLLTYDPETHIFELSENAIIKIDAQKDELHKVPFGVKADGELIYTAYFWASYSSAICDWLTADPYVNISKGLKIRLGYPGYIDGIHIPDERNNQDILDIFEGDGKLK